MTNYESLYSGATYLLDPNYQFTGYRVQAGSLGGTTSIQTANQLKEVNNLLNSGYKNTEVSLINPEVFEMVPKEHFKEINRLNKLTGASSSLHAPTLDPSGFVENTYSEEQRQAVARQFEDFVKRAHDLDPKGNVPVTIHASVIPGSEIIPEIDEKTGKNKLGRMIAVDVDTGKLAPMEREVRYYPDEEEADIRAGKKYEPEEELRIHNNSYWDNQLSQLVYYKKEGDELLNKNYALIANKKDLKNLTPAEKIALENTRNAASYYKNTHQSINGLFNQAYKAAVGSGDEKTKDLLIAAAEKFKIHLAKYEENRNDMDAYQRALQTLISSMQKITDPNVARAEGRLVPQKYVPVEQFAKEKAADTLSDVALSAYKKFGNTAPIVSIENPPYGQAFASGEDLAKLVEETRKKFEAKLKSEGKTGSEASAIAAKLIGATWDTSHIAMIRKQGFENKKITEETKKIAPFVKHVHFNDNFGSTHTDLPPGMGSVPIKDVLEVLEKNKVKGKRIFEGGNFFQHFQKSPFPYLLQNSGAVMWDNAPPFYNQLGGLGNYYSGHGPVNPSLHHTLYGAGFTALPVELGGEMPGQQSRFSGAPNQ